MGLQHIEYAAIFMPIANHLLSTVKKRFYNHIARICPLSVFNYCTVLGRKGLSLYRKKVAFFSKNRYTQRIG